MGRLGTTAGFELLRAWFLDSCSGDHGTLRPKTIVSEPLPSRQGTLPFVAFELLLEPLHLIGTDDGALSCSCCGHYGVTQTYIQKAGRGVAGQLKHR